MDPARFVLLDETAATTAMRRRYGRHPQARLLAARARRDRAPGGPMTGPGFRACVEQLLPPALKPGGVVVLDNLSAHNVDGVLRRSSGQAPRSLPSYGPDLHPIEQLLARLKALLRKPTPRTGDEPWSTIGQLLAAIPSTECATRAMVLPPTMKPSRQGDGEPNRSGLATLTANHPRSARAAATANHTRCGLVGVTKSGLAAAAANLEMGAGRLQ